MEILVYIVFGFAVLQFGVSLVNFIFSQKLPQADRCFQPLISVLIPARNEEKNIGDLLHDLNRQVYQNIEILVYNDQSTDKTANIVLEAIKTDPRIRLLQSEGLPDGWTGKNHACFSLSKQAMGKYLLFLDADVRLSGEIIPKAVTMMQIHRLKLLSIFPKQVMKTHGEAFTVPVMNYVLLTLLPLILVRKLQFHSLSAANGQFMLFDSETYQTLQPHQNLRNRRVEDIETARMYKLNKQRIACLTGSNEIRCRMYTNYPEAVNGLSRSVLMFFGNSAVLAVLFWMLVTFGFVLVAFELPMKELLIYFSILVTTRVLTSAGSRQNILQNIAFGFIQKISLGIMIGKAIRSRSKKNLEWKGRLVS